MAKEVVKLIKLQIKAGAANPSPPVGPALGQAGVNIMAFCKEFNAATQAQTGDVLPVVISVYKDKSFSFITKKPPAGNLLKKAAGLASGSKERRTSIAARHSGRSCDAWLLERRPMSLGGPCSDVISQTRLKRQRSKDLWHVFGKTPDGRRHVISPGPRRRFKND